MCVDVPSLTSCCSLSHSAELVDASGASITNLYEYILVTFKLPLCFHYFFSLTSPSLRLSLDPGECGLGKSTLINTLFKSKISRTSCTPPPHTIPQTVEVSSVSHGELGSGWLVMVVQSHGHHGNDSLIPTFHKLSMFRDMKYIFESLRLVRVFTVCVYVCACVVIEEQGVRLKLSVTDTPGFGDKINNDKW